MNLELFIFRRLAFSAQPSFAKFIVRVSIVAVALSMAVMILTSAIVTGFQKTISEKVFGFWGHVQIRSMEQGRSYEDVPITITPQLLNDIGNTAGIEHVQAFATKPGILKTGGEMEGVVLKGVDKDFDRMRMNEFLEEGKFWEATDSGPSSPIVISRTTANRLKLKTGDEVLVYFVQEPMRYRKYSVSGIYKTGMAEYDKLYCLVDISSLRKLNDWMSFESGGLEIYLVQSRQAESMATFLNDEILPNEMAARSLASVNPNLFDWLNLQSMNERVIFILMLLVAVINMTTMLLILILERTNMIGMLKALGLSNNGVQKIFIYNGTWIAAAGILLGNSAGLLLAWLQKKFELIRLPEESYYVSVAPVHIDAAFILLLNAGTILLVFLLLFIPSFFVRRISPVQALRFT
jgi:lipoprotein-releasing system permease protein